MGYLVQLVVSLAVFAFLLIAPRMLTSSSGSEQVVQEKTVADTAAAVQSVRLTALGSSLVSGSDAARLSPDRVAVKVNEPVSLLLTNSGSLTHQLYIPYMPGATEATRLAPGEIVWIKFTPTDKGQYTLQCAIPEHTAIGMRTTIVVQ